MTQGKARELSLGTFDRLELVDAIATAADLRARAKRGEALDSVVGNQTGVQTPKDRFRDVAEQLQDALKPGWKEGKHADDWLNSLKTHVYPMLGDRAVADITTEDVLTVLRPLWAKKHETATRVRQRIEAVLAAARARGLRSGENPAAWRGNLDLLLPSISKRKRVQHHAAMDWRDVPAFMAELRRREHVSSWTLQLTILTAARTGEVIGARWPEFSLDAALWVIPATRMKAQREHRVPLPAPAVDVLRKIPRMDGSDVVFWGGRLRKPRDGIAAGAVGPISNLAMLELLRGMRPSLTVHGFRSAFRDWAAEATSFPAEVVEMALAHTIQNQVEAAYRRGDLLEKRRELMQAWGDYLGTNAAG